MSHVAHLSLGSNVGDREANLHQAIRHLDSQGRIVAISPFYETEPVEFTEQAWFLNCAVALESAASPHEVLRQLLQIEQKMGRERIQKKGPRSIDIDILLFDDLVVNTRELTIPHPAMASRRFVLEPLAEIAPDLQHPILHETVRELLAELPAGQKVQKYHPQTGTDHTYKPTV